MSLKSFGWRVGLTCARLFARLPYDVQMDVGRWLGRASLSFAKKRRNITEANLRHCFPELSEEALQHRLVLAFESAGMGVAETMIAWFRPKLDPKLCQIEGIAHLEAALRQKKGVLILGAHMTCLEVIGRFFAKAQPYRLLYRKHENPGFEALMSRARGDYVDELIDRSDVRKIVRSLKANWPIWYAPDQDFGIGNAVFAPFFGVQAATTVATSRLVKMTSCQVVPVSFYRLPHAQGYKITFHPAWTDFPKGSDEQDCQRINQFIESVIFNAPEQYLWQHRRFKTRPAGESSLY
ncbi:LpxL/LpxP family acyltransferase [Piscirickettsia litoralis]|uniref:Lipid A biosynthesis acyltransferase n=1 Tax=Piscirickettsia litoralis TaxID=1891921 RepID=A0ABX3A0J7_9GAMM|nr:lipid A biosynthesis acyltransferase [Piscirickettsia litoralis]ODN42386.1 lipid A biosynthesis acyltransferase [Piscirickettsia litoralis]